MSLLASIPSALDKPGWYSEDDKYVEIAKTSSAAALLIGDSIIHGLARLQIGKYEINIYHH